MDWDILKTFNLRRIRVRLTLLAALFSLLPAVAQAQFAFVTNADNTITITGYTGSDGNVIIPNTIEGLPVASIGDWAFYEANIYSANVLSVQIPNSVTNVGNAAFYSCNNLTNVTIPGSVISIGEWAFHGCTSLTNIIIPNSVSSIGDDAFANCNNLNSVIIPDGVTSIGFQTFVNCAGLTDVAIPNSVTNIGAQAFISCVGLTNVIIPGNCINIGTQAFYQCTSLVSATMSDGVTHLGDQVFKGCSSLVNVTVSTNIASIGNETFMDCTSLPHLVIPGGVTDIGEGVCWNCRSLVEVVIPDSVTNVGSQAFEHCSGLTNIVIPESVLGIEYTAFYQCSGLTTVTIPGSVISIGTFAFDECTNLMDINVDPTNAFYSSVDGVLFNKDQTSLLQCPAGKTGNYTIPDSVTVIGANEAFGSCVNLTNVIVPDGVTYIEQSAFSGSVNLRGIYFSGNAPGFVGLWAFYGATNATVYHLPGTTGWDTMFAGVPTALWLPEMDVADASSGAQTNQFGFNVNWASGQTVVVEACTNLSNPDWQPVHTNVLTTGSAQFSDPQWTNYPGRFYRLRSQ